MSEENTVVTKIVKGAVRYRYPWKSLVNVGDYFTIPAEIVAGTTNARQLCYAANKSAQRKGLSVKYKADRQTDGSVVIKRIA